MARSHLAKARLSSLDKIYFQRENCIEARRDFAQPAARICREQNLRVLLFRNRLPSLARGRDRLAHRRRGGPLASAKFPTHLIERAEAVLGDRKTRASSTARTPDDFGLVALFLLFSQLGLSSFGGGVSAWMHRAFVERRGWLGEAEFSAALALARIMPGVNVVNLAVLIGQRVRGASGAAAAVLGLLIGPSGVAIGLMIAYGALARSLVLQAAIEGAAAAAAGLLIAMGVSSAMLLAGRGTRSRGGVAGASPVAAETGHAAAARDRLRGRRRAAARLARRWPSLGGIAVLLIVFVLIGLLRLPTVPVVLVLAPVSIALALRSAAAERPDGG
jgi:chromate transporter